MSSKDFNEVLQRTVAREVAPKEHNEHPDLEVLLSVLASDAPDETRGTVVGHVATCLACQKKWHEVEQTLALRQDRIEARVPSPGLAQLVREHAQAQAREPARGVRRRFFRLPEFRLGPILRPALVPVLASASAVAITLSIGVPLLRGVGTVPSEQWIALTQEVESLRDTTYILASALIRSGVGVPADILRPEITAEQLEDLKVEAEKLDDPWQRVLYVAARLNRWGIEPSAVLNWQSLEPYTVRPGDTWQSLASQYLGDRAAWPVLWLLNSDVIPSSEDPLVGSVVLLPTPTK